MMLSFESDHEGSPLLGLPTNVPDDETAWFWVVHTARNLPDFFARKRAQRCLQAGGGILVVSRGGVYEGGTAEEWAEQAHILNMEQRKRVYVLPSRFANETAARVRLFMDRNVDQLDPWGDIPWNELAADPAPSDLLAYYLLSFLGSEGATDRARIYPLAEAEYIAISGHVPLRGGGLPVASGAIDINNQEQLGEFLRALREDM